MTKLLQPLLEKIEEYQGVTLEDMDIRSIKILMEAAHSAGMIDQMTKDAERMNNAVRRITIN